MINGCFKTTSGNFFDNHMNIFHKTNVQTCSAPQNDRLNLSFAKDIYMIAQKRPEVVIKRPFIIRKFWETPSSLYTYRSLTRIHQGQKILLRLRDLDLVVISNLILNLLKFFKKWKRNPWLHHDLWSVFRVLGMYNFVRGLLTKQTTFGIMQCRLSH